MFINCNRIFSTMEHQKILSLLNKASDSKFMTRKWIITNDQSNNTNYYISKNVFYSIKILKANLCNFSDV